MNKEQIKEVLIKHSKTLNNDRSAQNLILLSKKYNDGAFKVLPPDMIKVLFSFIDNASTKEINFIVEKSREGKDAIIMTRNQFIILSKLISRHMSTPAITFYPKNSCMVFGGMWNSVSLQTIFINKDFEYYKTNPNDNFYQSLVNFGTLLEIYPNCNYVLWSSKNKAFRNNEGFYAYFPSEGRELKQDFFIGGGRLYSESHGRKFEFSFYRDGQIQDFDCFDDLKNLKSEDISKFKECKLFNYLSKNIKCDSFDHIFDLENKLEINICIEKWSS